MQFDMCTKRLRDFFMTCLQYDSDDLKSAINSYDFGTRSALYMDLEGLQYLLTKEVEEKFLEMESHYDKLLNRFNIKEVLNESIDKKN